MALGGNDPFGLSQYRPVPSPLPVTPSVIDRLTLSACAARVAADRGKPARVFTDLDLEAAAVRASNKAVQAQVTALFRVLLRREPSAQESAAVAALADGADAARFATMACYAISTTSEGVLL